MVGEGVQNVIMGGEGELQHLEGEVGVDALEEFQFLAGEFQGAAFVIGLQALDTQGFVGR